MKKISILVLFACILFANKINAQILTNGNVSSSVLNSNVLIDGSTNYSVEAGAGPNVGKGIIVPSVDLVNFAFDLNFADGSTFPTYFDGMVVYNRATGTTSITGNNPSTTTAVTPGFYYFSNPNGATNGNVTAGRWIAIGGGTSKFVDGTPATSAVYTAGNVGIGASTTPNATAILDLNSTTSGLLVPRMTSTQRDAISSPANGLMIYNTTIGNFELFSSDCTCWSGLIDNHFKENQVINTNGKKLILTDDVDNNPVPLTLKSTKQGINAVQMAFTNNDDLTFFVGHDGGSLGTGGYFIYDNINNSRRYYATRNFKTTIESGGGLNQGLTINTLNATNNSELVTINGVDQNIAMKILGDGSVGLGDNPETSAQLSLNSTTKGFLPPRVTTTQMLDIQNPAEGLVVYNSSAKLLMFFNGSAWMSSSGLAGPSSNTEPVISSSPTIITDGMNVTFTCSPGVWTGSPTFSFQWFKNGTPLSGEINATYTTTIATNDIYYCVLTAANSLFSTIKQSNSIFIASGPPAIVSSPVVTRQVNTYSTTNGSWTNSPTFTYQWFSNSIPISGATSSTYTLDFIYLNTSITCQVTATNSAGNTIENSNDINSALTTDSVFNNNTAIAIYSLRKLNSTYTGALIKVRRSSDDVEQDISYDEFGNLNQSALLSFVGASNSGFVTTWYDQSGNNRNATQTTSSNQPQIVNSGAVIVNNGKPSLRQTTNNQILNLSTSWLSGLTSATVSTIFRQNANFGDGSPYRIAGDQPFHVPFSGTDCYDGFMTTSRYAFSGYGSSSTSNVVHTAINSGSSLSVFKNGTQIGTSQTAVFEANPTVSTIFQTGYGLSNVSELIIFSNALDVTNRDTLVNNQKGYFGID